MTEGEWMGDRWSMMLSLKKKLGEKRKEENVSLSPLFLACLTVGRTREREKKKKREKQKLSSPLETNQLDFFFFFFLHFFTPSLLFST